MPVDMVALEALASQNLTILRLKDLHRYATNADPAQRLLNAQFLLRELPIRMARRAVDLLTLPHGLSQTKQIQEVARIYLRDIKMLQEQKPPTTFLEDKSFTDMIQSLVIDRTSIPLTISQGINIWVESNDKDEVDSQTMQEIEEVLNRFFTNRVGIRFLVQHHVLCDPDRKPEDLGLTSSATLGCIQPDCDAVKQVRTAMDSVTEMTQDCYGVCPSIELIDSRTKKGGFTHIPHLVQYIVTALLKNSCQATVARYAGSKEPMPPIKVVVVQGEEDVTIKVTDQGGGAPRSILRHIWNFTHSVSPDDSLEDDSDFGKDSAWGVKIGFGLPLARIYARYFGGELELLSTEGQGVDAYLYLPRLGASYEKLQSERINMWTSKRWISPSDTPSRDSSLPS